MCTIHYYIEGSFNVNMGLSQIPLIFTCLFAVFVLLNGLFTTEASQPVKWV